MDGASGAGTPHVELRLLGPIEAERDGAASALGGQKPRALLAVLALGPGRVVSVDRLVEALWPTRQPDNARRSLQVTISELRQMLRKSQTTSVALAIADLQPEMSETIRFNLKAADGTAVAQEIQHTIHAIP